MISTRFGSTARMWAVAAILSVFGAGSVARQSPAPRQKADPPPKKAAESGRPWHMTFDELVHNDATGEGEAIRVVATSDQDTVIKADLITWNDKRMIARATGNLTVTDEQADASADRADIMYARSKRQLVLSGNVRITLKPRKGETSASGAPRDAEREQDGSSDIAEARRYPIEVTCDRVDYEYAKDRRHAVLTGNFRAVQKMKDYTRTLTAERAEWFGLEDKVVISGPAHVEDTKGRKGQTTEEVVISTREGQEGIQIRKGVYSIPIEDDDQPSAKPPDKETPPPGQSSNGSKPE